MALKNLKKALVVILLLGVLLTIAYVYSGKHKPQPTTTVPVVSKPIASESSGQLPAQEGASAGVVNEAVDEVTEATTADISVTVPPTTLNLQLPKPEVSLVESNIVLPDSQHDIKNLLANTKKEKQSGISVSGNVFIDEEKKPDPNLKAIDQLKGGEVNVKVKTK